MSVRRTVFEIFSVKEWRDIKTRGRDRSRSLKMEPFDTGRSYDFLLVGRCTYICMLHHFRVIWRWINRDLEKVIKVIQTGTIRKLGYGFLFPLHSNYGPIDF